MKSGDWVYDIETFPNVFTMSVEHVNAPLAFSFEISDRVNESKMIVAFLTAVRNYNGRLIGFNNLNFDYPVIHQLIRCGTSTAKHLYDKAKAVIQSQDDDKWAHSIKPTDRYVEQIDLYRIHHFDNKARSTGLKALEFNMRSESIEELPFPVGTILNNDQIDLLIKYNRYDVAQTKKFYFHTQEMIKFREELTFKYQRDFMNHSDTKIGKDYFAMKLEEAGIACYDFDGRGRTPRQTIRNEIYLKDAILPSISFKLPEFNRMLEYLKSQVITETKSVFKDLKCTINGFDFVFGLGGIHGSLESRIIESDDDNVIIDLDVSSYYPNLAISNMFYPAHLGPKFCDIYSYLYEQRKNYPKNTAENAMLKLALNGVYGDSNNRFSVFYDPLFTMKITLNGQLLLCRLAEELIISGMTMIQINTDGLSFLCPKNKLIMVNDIYHKWETDSGLKLEKTIYDRMFIRDVNNYIAADAEGKIKRKGCYEYKLGWHQNQSALVVAKVAEKALVEGADIKKTLESWDNIMDFMIRVKVPKNSYLTIQHNGVDNRLQNTCRCYVSKGGGNLYKWMPPLKDNPNWRKIGVCSGWGVTICNNLSEFEKLPIDYNYYIQEVEKLCLGLM